MADSKRRSADDEFDGADDRTVRDGDHDDTGDETFDGEVLSEADDDAAEPAGRGRRSRAAAVRATSKPAPRAKVDRAGLLSRLIRFVREVVAELQKVIWPTRKELLTYASVVVVFLALMMAAVALLDLGFARAMIWVFGGGEGDN